MSQVLVDTNIWSTFFRRNKPEDQKLRSNLEMLMQENRISMIGPVRQEILTGIRDYSKFLLLKEYLQAFDDEPITTEAFEYAAKVANECMKNGIAISSGDAIIVSMIALHGFEIYTNDQDFARYKKIVQFIQYQER
ncbi:MAG: PIN domain-containing protein [Fibrobacteres bacterium]|nr:PIN domain-containing protein [Fibrobacterota bacterium]